VLNRIRQDRQIYSEVNS